MRLDGETQTKEEEPPHSKKGSHTENERKAVSPRRSLLNPSPSVDSTVALPM